MAALSALLAIGGCAVAPLERAADSAAGNVSARTGATPEWSATGTRPAVAGPLTLPAALALAFAQNPEIRRQYARLGIAHAELEDAARIANPRLSFTWLDPAGGGRDETTRGITASFSGLLLLPARRRLSAAEFQRVELDVTAHLVTLARDVETAWYSHIGALQIAAMRDAAAQAAATEAELAGRFHAAGNISRLDLDLREAEATRLYVAALQARSGAVTARARLADLLGLQASDEWETADRLPAPLDTAIGREQLSQLAQAERFDLAALRKEIAMLEDAVRVTRRWRLLGSTEFGYKRERELDGTKQRGPTLDVELPLFNQRQGAIERAEARLADARARHEALVLTTQNEISAGLERLNIAREIAARHRDSLLPAVKSVVARRQEQVNFMLRSVFELLAAKRDEYDAWQAWLESVRDYWIARSALAAAAGGRLPGDGEDWPLTVGADEITGGGA
jgi:outer membrane protein TolC